MVKKLIGASIVASVLLGAALPAFAETGTTTPPVTEHKERKPVDLACMQTAVGKRDDAVIAAVDAHHDSVKAALVARRDALKAAWGLTDRKARRDALAKAWTDFRMAVRDAQKTLKMAKRAAWKNFEMDRKACNGNNGDDHGSEGHDENL